MVQTRAQAEANEQDDPLETQSPGSPTDSEAEDSDSDDEMDDSLDLTPSRPISNLDYWQQPDARTASKNMLAKLAELGSAKKEADKKAGRDSDKGLDSPLDVFASGSKGSAAFDFAKSINDDGPGGMNVVVDPSPYEDSPSSDNAYHTWQLQRQEQLESPSKRASRQLELGTLGLFAKLPGELRNRIYRLVLVMPLSWKSFPITMPAGTCSLGPCIHSRLPTAVPGILSTCRQVRNEAMPILLSENCAFNFDVKMVEARCIANWIQALGPYAALIKRLELQLMLFERGGIAQTKEIELTCPAGPLRDQAIGDVEKEEPSFEVVIDTKLGVRAEGRCEKLEKHVEDLTKRVQNGEAVEGLILEFVASDWFAEVVWRCKK